MRICCKPNHHDFKYTPIGYYPGRYIVNRNGEFLENCWMADDRTNEAWINCVEDGKVVVKSGEIVTRRVTGNIEIIDTNEVLR